MIGDSLGPGSDVNVMQNFGLKKIGILEFGNANMPVQASRPRPLQD
jgi:hypothetical protein